MELAPLARIIMRYGIGYVIGSETGEALAMDPELVNMLALGLAACVEIFYGFAKKQGWAT
jgi:hypothetical protein